MPSKKSSLAPSVALSIIGSIVMLIAMLLPYASSKHDSMSVVTIAQRWKQLQNAIGVSMGAAEIIMVLVIAIATLAVLTLIFAIARKAIPTPIFAIATLLVFISFNSSFVPSSPYNYGFGYDLFYIAAIITVLGGIWMIVAKHQLKKA